MSARANPLPPVEHVARWRMQAEELRRLDSRRRKLAARLAGVQREMSGLVMALREGICNYLDEPGPVPEHVSDPKDGRGKVLMDLVLAMTTAPCPPGTCDPCDLERAAELIARVKP